jgi:hypothetical protein
VTAERSGCSHIEAVETVRPPTARVCEECVKMSSRWCICERVKPAAGRGVVTPRPTGRQQARPQQWPSSDRLC